MYSELLEAANGDYFFISKSDDGKDVGIKILNLSENNSNENDYLREENYECYTIPDDSKIKSDLLFYERNRKTEEESDALRKRIKEIQEDENLDNSTKQDKIM